MLALAAVDGLIGQGLSALGASDGAVDRLEPVLATSLAAGGFVLIVVALFRTFSHNSNRALVGPYTEALAPFAAEFGRGVAATPGGVELHLVRDGQMVDVYLELKAPGRLMVHSPPPARQSLAWSRPGDALPSVASQWRDVEVRPQWRMTAELPAMARPLLTDTALMTAMARAFTPPWTRSVSHVISGITVQADLPPAEDVGAYVRMCTDLCFRLRRANG
jgi:hypothetical protein